MSVPIMLKKVWLVVLPIKLKCSSVFIWYCPLDRDGWIYPIPYTIVHTLPLHLSQFGVSSFKPIFSFSSSTCFFQVFFGHSYFFLPLTLRSRATPKTLSSSLFSTCPYHLTPFAVANPSIVFPSTSACPSVLHSSFCQQLSDCTQLLS